MTSNLLWPSVALLVAVGLLVLEALLPSGGVLSAMASLSFVVSIGLAYYQAGTAMGTVFLAVSMVIVPALIAIFIKYWPSTALGRRILIRPEPADEAIPEPVTQMRRFIGVPGMAVSPMVPSGVVQLEGEMIDAISEGMFIDQGTPVKVVAVRGNHLVVRPATADKRVEQAEPDGHSIADERVFPDPFEE